MLVEKPIPKYIFSLFKRGVNRDAIVVFGSKSLSAVLGVLSIVIIAKHLGVDEFGSYFFSITTIVIICEIIGKCINISFVSFYAKSINENAEQAYLIYKYAFKINLVAGFVVSICCFFFAEPVALTILNKPEFVVPLKFAAFGSFGNLIWGFLLSTLYARHLFNHSAVLEVIYNVVKVVFVLLLLFYHNLTLVNSLIAYSATQYITVFLFLIVSPKRPRNGKEIPETIIQSFNKEFLRFNRWKFISSILYTIQHRIGYLMLCFFYDVKSIAIYSAAVNLYGGLDLITGTFMTVLLPRVSKFSKKEDFSYFIKRFLKVMVPFSFILLVLILGISNPLFTLTYAEDFFSAVPVFRILVLGGILYLIAAPLCLCFYAINKPELITYMDICAMIISVLSGILLIPTHGIIGAALVALITKLFVTSCVFFMLYHRVYPNFSVRPVEVA